MASILRSVLLAMALLFAVRPSFGQAEPGTMNTGVLDIRSDAERRIFAELLCTCGCPRDSLATCTCGYAAGFRDEIRGMMARGLTDEEIKAEWSRRYGQGALSVPPNEGVGRLLYSVPLIAIALMGVFVGLTLRKFGRRGKEAARAAGLPGGSKDAYDARLDEELRRLEDDDRDD